MLKDYLQRQSDIFESNAARIVERGHLTGYRDLYPEVDISDLTISYSRRSMQIALPLLLYDKVSFLVPAMPEEWFASTIGISLPDIKLLIDAQLIQPLISDPEKYDTPTLGFLLERDVPSVLERGKRTLSLLELDHLLDPQASSLPLAELSKIPELRTRMKAVSGSTSSSYITKQVINDLLVNYADLIVFGQHELAKTISEQKDPRAIARLLYDYAEVIAYPQLFGFGGSVNYSPANLLLDTPPSLDQRSLEELTRFDLDQRELEQFLQGIEVPIGALDAKTVIDFHEDGQAIKLREAMRFFEGKALAHRAGDGAVPQNEAEAVKRELLEASRQLQSPRFRYKLKEMENDTQFYLQIGGIALASVTGALIGLASSSVFGGALVAVGAGTAASKVVIPKLQNAAQSAVMKKLINPGLANLWTIRSR